MPLIKYENIKCCLTVSPALKIRRLIESIKRTSKNNDRLEQKVNGLNLVDMSMVSNTFEPAQCKNSQEFLCHQISESENPFCLECGRNHYLLG